MARDRIELIRQCLPPSIVKSGLFDANQNIIADGE